MDQAASLSGERRYRRGAAATVLQILREVGGPGL